MKVFVYRNIGTGERNVPPLAEGQHDVSESVGAELCRRGFAEALIVAPTKPPEIKAVPPKKYDKSEKKSNA